MKTIITIILLSFISIFSAQSLNLSVNEVDFGTIKKGAKAEYIVTVTNNGTAPLVISDIKSSCGCTVPVWPKKPILPNKSEKIKVAYDSNKVGQINKVLEIFSNDTNKARKIIKVTGNITN